MWFVEVFGSFWAWFQWTLRSRQVILIILLGMFFVFEGLWRKFFRVLEAWIRRASLICGLLRFLEVFELDSSDLWDLGKWFGWFLFECFLYSKLKFLKFLEALRLGFNRDFAYIIAYTRWIAYVIVYTCWTACVIAYTRWCVILFLHDTWQISVGFWVVIAKPSRNTWCFIIGCILWTW